MEDYPMNIDERFEKLEKQIKNLKKMLGGVATLALAALIGGTALGVHAANGSFDILRAKTLYLKDSSGKTRVQLLGSSGQLYLKDASGKNRVKLGSNAFLTLRDSSGKKRVALGSGGLYLKNARGKDRVTLKGATGDLILKDDSGKTRVHLKSLNGSLKLSGKSVQRVYLDGGTGKITASTISAAHTHSGNTGSNVSHSHPARKHSHTNSPTSKN
jgi:DUF4097 and DUF4098 domain-containing protein YvlB